jgi:hypothetical protein
MAGHDYDRTLPGVIRAVNEFAERLAVNVYLTHEPRFTSWYLSKTESLWEAHRRSMHEAVDPDRGPDQPPSDAAGA